MDAVMYYNIKKYEVLPPDSQTVHVIFNETCGTLMSYDLNSPRDNKSVLLEYRLFTFNKVFNLNCHLLRSCYIAC